MKMLAQEAPTMINSSSRRPIASVLRFVFKAASLIAIRRLQGCVPDCDSVNPCTFPNRYNLKPLNLGSSTDSFLNLPLLKEDLDYYNGAAALLASRVSLSSSSSSSSSSSGSHDYDVPPRLSLDSDRPHSRSLHRNPTRMRQLNSRLENPRIDQQLLLLEWPDEARQFEEHPQNQLV